MKLRYNGSDDARDLAVAGGFLQFPRGEWVDIEDTAAKTGIAVDHALIVARAVAEQDDWESDDEPKPKKAAKPRAREENKQ